MTELRAEPVPGVCQCVLVYTNPNGVVACDLETSGPDDPFCGGCETRHPTFAERGVVVTVRGVTPR